MNQAFYVLFSTVLLLAWLFTVLFTDRLTYWEFAPGLITRRQRFSEGGRILCHAALANPAAER